MTENFNDDDLDLPNYEIVAGPSHLNFPVQQSHSRWEDIDFSVDLLSSALLELEFLQTINKNTDLSQDEVLINAIRRYETVWLPLRAQIAGDLNIFPPLDVHWIWHCHMLNPIGYQQDCLSLVGTFLDHAMVSKEQNEAGNEISVAVWTQFAPNEPFDYQESASAKGAEWYEKQSSYDLYAAVARQRNFIYQISLPHYSRISFLEPAVVRYKKFLFLKKLYPDQFLTPCYDFDLVWHAHQIHPLAYQADTQRIIGRVFPHDDSSNDRTTGSRLLQGEALTKQLWACHFGDDDMFWRRGSMFRGHDHPSTLGISKESPVPVNHGRLYIKGSAKKPEIERDLLKLKMTYGKEKIGRSVEVRAYSATDYSLKFAGTFAFDRAEQPDDLHVLLRAYDYGLIRRKRVITLRGKCSLAQLLPPNLSRSTIDLSDDSGQHMAMVNLETQVAQKRYFNIVNGDFSQRDLLPDDNSSMFKLCYAAAMNKAPARTGNPLNIWIADHRLIDLVDQTTYTVRVIHSASLLLSLILVLDIKGRVLAMAHLLGPDTLPSSEQLTLTDSGTAQTAIPMLSSPLERAVLISDSKGDFSVIHGVWMGFKPRSLGTGGIRATPGNPGRLKVKVFGLRNSKNHEFTLGSNNLDFSFQNGAVTSSLNSNTISMTNVWKNTASNIASVFSIGLLFTLTNPDKIRSQRSPAAGGIPCHTWPLILAAGYSRPSPSVRYLATEYHRQTSAGSDVTDSAGPAVAISKGSPRAYDPTWWAIGALAVLGWDAGGMGYHHTDHGNSAFSPPSDVDGDAGACGACAACGTSGSGGAGAGEGTSGGGGGWFGSSGDAGGAEASGGIFGGDGGGFGGNGGNNGGDGGGCGSCGGCGGGCGG